MSTSLTTYPARKVTITAGRVALHGDLVMPPSPTGLVIFAHGSGSSRKSPRNQAVARELNAGGLATLLADLLTPEEESMDRWTGKLRFDIPLLGERVVALIDWQQDFSEVAGLPLGLFGASTGAAAALLAAAARPKEVKAVVSRGGRPDLARSALNRVEAATLLIVGGYDDVVLDWNRDILPMLGGEKELIVIPKATHLFEEPGALEEVARHARDWFRHHLEDGQNGRHAFRDSIRPGLTKL